MTLAPCSKVSAWNKSRVAAKESRDRHLDFRLPAKTSDRHLRAYFHHPPGGNLEIVGGIIRDAREHDEQVILPARHAGMGGRLERAPGQEKRRRHDVELPAVLAGNGER